MLQAVVDLAEVGADAEQASCVEDRGGRREHGQVDEAGDAHRDHDVHHLEVKDLSPCLLVRADDPLLGQRRVQVDHVRHHRGAQDARGEQDGLGAIQVRDEGVARHRAP